MSFFPVRFTTKYVSPALQQTELEAVGKTTTTHGNMEVSVHVQWTTTSLGDLNYVVPSSIPPLPVPPSLHLDSVLQVRAYVGVSEVSVVYRLHEFSIELFVHLPSNYPLQPPSIREGKRARVEASQWRKWMLQLNVFVANQVEW